MRVTILIHSLGCGGAERVACILANGLRRGGHDVTVVTLEGPHVPAYPLRQDVTLAQLGACGPRRSPWDTPCRYHRQVQRVTHALRRAQPDVLIGFMTGTNVLGILSARVFARLPCRVVVSERVHPSLTNRRGIACAARVLTFPLADVIVPCSVGMAPWFTAWLPARKVVPIQNPVLLGDRPPDPIAEARAAAMQGQHWVLGMGRLDTQKGFDMLLEAFARVPGDVRAGWRLGIIGEGEMCGDLERCIRALGLEGEAVLLGRFANPYPLLRAGKIFALSSRYEGFPNALTEAMACGMASVAFDCPTGPGEIIRQGEDGLLVRAGDVAEMSGALGRLMTDEGLREGLARRAPEVLERFSERRFLDEWETLVGQVRQV